MSKLAVSREQTQFLDVVDRDEAERRFRAAIGLHVLGHELVPLPEALGRVLVQDVVAPTNVPSFDRSNFDGFAVRAADTYGANEQQPRRLKLHDEVIATAVVPRCVITPGTAVSIATGGVVPRGADAIVMIEHTDTGASEIAVRRAATSGFGIAFAGTDIAAGETVLRRGQRLTSRETAVLAAIGVAEVNVVRRPRVAIISTGDELISPGDPSSVGTVYDSNARVLADAVRELGAEPVSYGIVGDDIDRLRDVVRRALEATDVVVMSGGTSKGAGDVSYQVAGELTDPGIVVHGVALKPGKPICLAVTRGKPVVILPGFPTSAVFTFHEFVAPLIQQLGGMSPSPAETCRARVAVKINSEIGRTEYMLVGLVHRTASENADVAYAAYPLGKGSGSVTTFSHADGFIKIDRHCELVEANSTVTVQLLSRDLRAADLIVIGSNCIGLDVLLGHLWRQSISSKILAVGSLGGLEAAKRGECDVAGVHLLDAASGEYNTPFLTDELALLRGYGRRQGIVYRPGDPTFDTREPQQAVARALANSNCVMVNRNAGSGTRILIDQCLAGQRPPGYAVQPRSHHAVAAAVSQHRADWGVAIEQVARAAGLGFLPLTVERFDFVIPRSRWSRKATVLFRRALEDAQVRRELEQLGFELTKETA